MNHRRRRRMTIRPSKSMITFSRVFGGIFAAVALGFLYIGVTELLPNAGPFCLIWTVMSLGFVGIGVYGACNKKGMYFSYEWNIDEESEGDASAPSAEGPAAHSAEARLAELQRLYDQHLITAREFEEKRQEILRDL